MAAEETTIRVRLDTGPAKGALRELEGQGTRSAKRVARETKREQKRSSGFTALALGTGIGVGVAATRSGIGDIVSESFSGIGARVNEFFLGALDDKARAQKRALTDIQETFGYRVGVHDPIPEAAKTMYDNLVNEYFEEERGKSRLQQEFGGNGLLEAVLDRIKVVLFEAVDRLTGSINKEAKSRWHYMKIFFRDPARYLWGG